MDDCPQKDARVLDELLTDGSIVLFHQISRQLMTLNPTAALIWDCCDGTHTPAAIATELRQLFPDVPGVLDDVIGVLADLREKGMLGADGQ